MDEITNLHRMADILSENAQDLELELNWFAQVLDARLKLYFKTDQASETTVASIFDIPPPNLSHSHSYYAQLIRQHNFSSGERLAILLALIPQKL
jgi:hypothetical protein